MKTRILIIDDEPRWIDFVKNDLSRFEIVVASTIEEALKQLEDDQFDLVIASSGHLDIIKEIGEKYADKRVIVTTVRPNTQEALNAYRLGAVRYFPKSFGSEDLLNRVRELLPLSSKP